MRRLCLQSLLAFCTFPALRVPVRTRSYRLKIRIATCSTCFGTYSWSCRPYSNTCTSTLYMYTAQTIGGQRKCFYSEFHALSDHQKTVFSDDRLAVRETLSKNTSSVLLLFEPALPLGIEHSLGQPGTSLLYTAHIDHPFQVIYTLFRWSTDIPPPLVWGDLISTGNPADPVGRWVGPSPSTSITKRASSLG